MSRLRIWATNRYRRMPTPRSRTGGSLPYGCCPRRPRRSACRLSDRQLEAVAQFVRGVMHGSPVRDGHSVELRPGWRIQRECEGACTGSRQFAYGQHFPRFVGQCDLGTLAQVAVADAVAVDAVDGQDAGNVKGGGDAGQHAVPAGEIAGEIDGGGARRGEQDDCRRDEAEDQANASPLRRQRRLIEVSGDERGTEHLLLHGDVGGGWAQRLCPCGAELERFFGLVTFVSVTIRVG